MQNTKKKYNLEVEFAEKGVLYFATYVSATVLTSLFMYFVLQGNESLTFFQIFTALFSIVFLNSAFKKLTEYVGFKYYNKFIKKDVEDID